MAVFEYGNPSADIVLVQMVDDHDLAFLDREVAAISENTARAFKLAAMKVDLWNEDLSPWNAPAVFGREPFGGRASNTLSQVQNLCADRSKTYYIGGYSLAGLFALWAAYQTDLFQGVAAASPSIWFPGFADFMKAHEIQSGVVYLSLGDKEEKTKNPVMSTVGERIREAYKRLSDQGINCVLEWNQGNHFKNADLRTARAFAWVMEQQYRSARIKDPI